jgi:hypothetical protein
MTESELQEFKRIQQVFGQRLIDNQNKEESKMKEGILACITVLLFIAMMIGVAAYHTQTQHQCTVAGMMAEFSASEIRSVCNIK